MGLPFRFGRDAVAAPTMLLLSGTACVAAQTVAPRALRIVGGCGGAARDPLPEGAFWSGEIGRLSGGRLAATAQRWLARRGTARSAPSRVLADRMTREP